MSYIVGPINVIGYPFGVTHEVPYRRMVGDRITYAFSSKWFTEGAVEIIPEEDVSAVVVWDPAWTRTESKEMEKIWLLARKFNAPVIGIYCDWFSAWSNATHNYGTPDSAMFCDALITDPAGKSTLETLPPLKIKDPKDLRYRPIVEIDNMLSYGRLPVLGKHTNMVRDVAITHPHKKRKIDVCYIGNPHADKVVLRSYYLDQLQKICDASGFNLVSGRKYTTDDMEQVLLDSRVCFNHSLGTQLNMRIYEAASAGCMILTDSHNIANYTMNGAAWTYHNAGQLKWHLRKMLALEGEKLDTQVQKSVDFALAHTPEIMWGKLFDEVDKAVTLCKKTTKARAKMELDSGKR